MHTTRIVRRVATARSVAFQPAIRSYASASDGKGPKSKGLPNTKKVTTLKTVTRKEKAPKRTEQQIAKDAELAMRQSTHLEQVYEMKEAELWEELGESGTLQSRPDIIRELNLEWMKLDGMRYRQDIAPNENCTFDVGSPDPHPVHDLLKRDPFMVALEGYRKAKTAEKKVGGLEKIRAPESYLRTKYYEAFADGRYAREYFEHAGEEPGKK